jgi:hypothetical protein
MRSVRHLHPEWGYLAPPPSFMHTIRIALVSAMVGVAAGIIVILSLVEPPRSNDDDAPIAARALVTLAPAPTSQVAGIPSANETAPAELNSTAAQSKSSGANVLSVAPAAERAPLAIVNPDRSSGMRSPSIVPESTSTAEIRPAADTKAASATVLSEAGPTSGISKKNAGGKHHRRIASNGRKGWYHENRFGSARESYGFGTGWSYWQN